jgi:endoribonuclease Dicer
MVIPADVGENLLPRRYQEEIFARAQEGNIIAALDTGSGKTFISLLLMKWVVAHGGGGTDKKVVVFLVPKVALVEQQADFISRHTPLRVKRFHGAMQIEMADRGSWKQEFESTDIVVLTGKFHALVLCVLAGAQNQH